MLQPPPGEQLAGPPVIPDLSSVPGGAHAPSVDPRRVWIVDESVPAEQRFGLHVVSGPRTYELVGGQFELMVRARPHRAVTFAGQDGGVLFANGQSSITIRADATGAARSSVRVTDAGVQRIVVGCPQAREPVTVDFLGVTILPPDWEAHQDQLAQRRAELAAERAAAATQPASGAVPPGKAELLERVRQRRATAGQAGGPPSTTQPSGPASP